MGFAGTRPMILAAAAALALSAPVMAAAPAPARGRGPDPVQPSQYTEGRGRKNPRYGGKKTTVGKHKGSKAARKKTDHRRHR